MADFVQHSVVQALAWALVHFVWQGAAIGLVSYASFRLVRRSASLRYATGVGALLAMLAAPVATFLVLANEPVTTRVTAASATGDPGVTGLTTLPAAAGENLAAPAPRFRVSPTTLAGAVLAWCAGVTFFSLRLIGGWIVARRYAWRAVQPASDQIQGLARQLAERLAVRRAVAILQSSAVTVPMMVGWLKPTIVLPLAALAGLSPTQVEALLAHELAHVRRHDYLVNLLQSVAEALLFYHPAVWWLSRRVRAERELCCDDLAVGVCDRLVYATALTDLATMASPRVALAATDGDLLSRVRRILGRTDEAPAARAGVMPVLALALVAGIAVPAALSSAAETPGPAPVVRLEPTDAPAPQTPPVKPQTPPPAAPPTASQAPPQTAQQHADQQRAEELRRKYVELQKELAQLDLKRVEEFRQQATEQHKKALEQAQAAKTAALDAARKRFEDAQKQFNAGLISEQQFLEAKAALANAQATGETQALVAAELRLAEATLRQSHVLVERGLLASKDAVELTAAAKAIAQRAAESAASARQLYELLAARRAIQGESLATQDVMARALRDRIGTALEGDLQAGLLQHVDPSTPAQAGDVLRIAIAGEPDLPATYRVAEDGTIRLPFVGAVKVVGLTAAQVRDAVGKQLAAKKLGSVDQVTVTIARPGTLKHSTIGPVIIKKGN